MKKLIFIALACNLSTDIVVAGKHRDKRFLSTNTAKNVHSLARKPFIQLSPVAAKRIMAKQRPKLIDLQAETQPYIVSQTFPPYDRVDTESCKKALEVEWETLPLELIPGIMSFRDRPIPHVLHSMCCHMLQGQNCPYHGCCEIKHYYNHNYLHKIDTKKLSSEAYERCEEIRVAFTLDAFTSEQDVTAQLDKLSKFKRVRKLCFCNETYSSCNVKYALEFINGLRDLNTLEEVELEENLFALDYSSKDTTALDAILDALSFLPNLKRFSLEVELSPQQFKKIASFQNLQVLDLWKFCQSLSRCTSFYVDDYFNSIIYCIQRLPILYSLVLPFDSFEAKDMQSFMLRIQRETSLEEVQLNEVLVADNFNDEIEDIHDFTRRIEREKHLPEGQLNGATGEINPHIAERITQALTNKRAHQFQTSQFKHVATWDRDDNRIVHIFRRIAA